MTVTPLRRQVMVACDQPTAYRLFIDDIAQWWPVTAFSCFGAGATVALVGDQLVETGPDGETATWGTITRRDEPYELSLSWHPGLDPVEATEVTVTFTPTGAADATLVTLVHRGWDVFDDAAARRGSYAGGWVSVLDRYVAAAPLSSEGEQWLVLEHTAGPAAPAEGIFASPDFPRHAEFLQRLAADGVLVAAGPLPDAAGTGMTIVRADGVQQAVDVVKAAQLDDGSVSSGLLDVRIRPWKVAIVGRQT